MAEAATDQKKPQRRSTMNMNPPANGYSIDNPRPHVVYYNSISITKRRNYIWMKKEYREIPF